MILLAAITGNYLVHYYPPQGGVRIANRKQLTKSPRRLPLQIKKKEVKTRIACKIGFIAWTVNLSFDGGG